jgi:glycosyltransferase involved in cell wall biosynthesis
MMDFAKYAFNKSHAACYAVVAYQTAWLKYYYPMEFMAALMTSVIDHPAKVASYILSCRAMKIRILPPDINEGEAGFSVSSGEYIAFLDADDWWEPTFLEKMAQLIEDYPEAGLYASNYMYYKPGKTRVAVKNIETGYFNYPKAYYEGEAMPVWTGATMIPRCVLAEVGGFPLGIKLGEDFLLWSKIAMQHKVAFFNEPLAWYNNDVPATLRATRNLHAPEHHMLFNLGVLGNEAIRQEKGKADITMPTRPIAQSPYRPTKDDWRRLIDKLRVNSLLDYWLDKKYHDQAAEQLKKVDWSAQPASAKRLYKTPIWQLKIKRGIMRWGSFVKRLLFRGRNKVATV